MVKVQIHKMKKLIAIFMLLSCTSDIIPLNPTVHIKELDANVLAMSDTGAFMTMARCGDIDVADDTVSFTFKGSSHIFELHQMKLVHGVNSTETVPVVLMNIGYNGRYKEVRVMLMPLDGFGVDMLLGRNWFGGKYLVHTIRSKR